MTDVPDVGAVVAGRYRIERVLGRGGMGVVVKATHLQLHQSVAIKFLLPEVLANREVVQRFLREAQSAVQLKSEHVARVIDVGALDSGAPYMVLEYLEGADLSSFSRAQLSVGGIVDLLLQACEALAEAHVLGIVHRDIKPANFFITRGPDSEWRLKVLDFGISKAPRDSGHLTATHTVMGTPAYMSPEQMRSARNVDHRSDIWSLGIVLYELLQGAPPFRGDTFSELVLQVASAPPARLTAPLPRDLELVVYRCLEKDPASRFQSVAELAQALARYARSDTQATISVQRTRNILARPARPGIQAGPPLHAAQTTLSGSAGAQTVQIASRRRLTIFAAGSLLVGSVGITAIVASHGHAVSIEHAAAPNPEPRVPVRAAAPVAAPVAAPAATPATTPVAAPAPDAKLANIPPATTAPAKAKPDLKPPAKPAPRAPQPAADVLESRN